MQCAGGSLGVTRLRGACALRIISLLPYDCFFSYASPDLGHAQKLHELLTAAGFRVWFDKVQLRERDGTQWQHEIEAGCEDSRIVLPILTPRWKLSHWTRDETYAAEAVIPILAEGTWDEVRTPPLARWQGHAVTGPLDPDRLIASIRALLAQPAPEKSDRIAHLRFPSHALLRGPRAGTRRDS